MAAGLQAGNPTNEPDKKPVKHHSHFKPSMSHYYGALAGLLNLSYAAQAVPGDEGFSIRCTSDIDTFSLKAPMMVPVRHKKAYFYVPKKAIIPKNADLLLTNPVTGEDVVPELVNTVINRAHLLATLKNMTQSIQTIFINNGSSGAGSGSWTVAERVFAILQLHEIGEMFLSSGSLLHRCGISTTPFWSGPVSGALQRSLTYDECMDYLFGWLKQYFQSFTVQLRKFDSYSPDYGQPTSIIATKSLTVNLDFSEGGLENTTEISLRQLLELLREWHVSNVTSTLLRDEYTTTNVSYIPPVDPDMDDLGYFSFTILQPSDASDWYKDNNWINLERVIAYQLACAQWYSNDVVDAVYTTTLWHSVMKGFVENTLYGFVPSQSGIVSFLPDTIRSYVNSSYCQRPFNATRNLGLSYTLNGLSQEYDSVSGACLGFMLVCLYNFWFQDDTATLDSGRLGKWIGNDETNYAMYQTISYWKNLMNPQRALRFKDYFVGSRTSPLAVGDVNVEVNDSAVNVVDITKNIMMQRFLNQVNRIHRTLKEYSRGIFGQSPMFDPREVMFIGSTDEVIGAEETENTGAAQLDTPQSITSHLRSNASRFAFTFDVPEFGVIIGITSFDFQRVYATVTDRETFHVDRFDDFNPYMQHIGDQAILGNEIGLASDNFGYQLRYAEYKQKTDRASGAFVGGYLPGYAPVAIAQNLKPIGSSTLKLDSDFIRMRPFEFDQFYLALTNFSIAGYFHFVVRDDYDVNISRPMEAAPSIL